MAPPTNPPTNITVRVKVPPGHLDLSTDEFTLGTDVPVSTNLGQVRQQIQQAIPSNPAPERMRLLYGGRALVDNEQTLADALNIRRDPSQNEYTVHLLVKGDGNNTTPVNRLSTSTPGTSGTSDQPAIPGRPALHGGHAPSTGMPPLHAQAHTHTHAPPNFAEHQNMHQRMAAALAQQQQHQGRINAPLFFQHQGQPFGGVQGHGHAMPLFAGEALPLNIPALPPHDLAQHELAHAHAHAQAQAQARAQAQAQSSIPTSTAQPPASHAGHAGHAGQTHEPLESQLSGGPPTDTPLPQQRSASQPPPRQQNGVIVNGSGIGPHGERITFHHHTMHIPNQQLPRTLPQGLPLHGSGPLPDIPPIPPHWPFRRNGTSALDQARENMAEMQRLLDEMHAAQTTPEERARIAQLTRRTGALNDYIDPLHLGTVNNQRPQRSQDTGPGGRRHVSTIPGLPAQLAAQQFAAEPMQQDQTANPAEVTCYLLSSPAGPQALLYSPQHGTYTSSYQAAVPLQPTPTTRLQNAGQPGQVDGAQEVAAPADAQNNGQNARPPAAVQPGGPLEPLLNNMWLLLRILIFSYFVLGANLGWRRPLALMFIGAGFWLIRQGLLGDGGPVRRWWENLVNEGRPAAAQAQPGQQQQAEGQEPGHAGNARPGRMPTPAEVAERLLNEDRNQGNQRVNWLREQMRPFERAIALLVASLWPGVGEAYVRALEEEERRRNEEELAARRREEEERQRQEAEIVEAEKIKAEGAASDEQEASSADADGAATSGTPATESSSTTVNADGA